MTLKVDEYKIGRKETDLAIFFPYTWGGDRHNNRKLLREVALLTGGLVVGAQTPGTGRLYVDAKTRGQLQHGRLAELATDYAGEVDEYLEKKGHPRRLLVAQSGRVALGARMQLSEYFPFTHTLLRDGVNLRAPESVEEGRTRLMNQPPAKHRTYPEKKSWLHRVQDKRAQLHGAVEVLTQGQLLCSPESVSAVTELALDTTSPLVHITFEEGITGTPEQQYLFRNYLSSLRIDAAARYEGEQPAAPLAAAVRPGTHGDLQNPLILHEHINWALDPLSPTAANRAEWQP